MSTLFIDESQAACPILAKRLCSESLLEYAKQYNWKPCMDVYKTEVLLKLSTEQLSKLLGNDNSCVPSEEQVLCSLLLRLEHDSCEIKKYKEKLLKLVRMALLDPTFLHVHVKPHFTSTLSLQLNREARAPKLGMSRRPRQYLIGITTNQFDNKMHIHYYCPHRLKWMRWVKDLEYRFMHSAAIMGHNMYIVAGTDVEEYELETILCLNMETMTLGPVITMTELRVGCGVAAFNGFLYVVGGIGRRDWLDSVERWDPITNAWNRVASLSVKRSHMGIAELNGKLYAVGGDDDDYLVEYYDPSQNVWTSIASMSEIPNGPGAAVANGRLYAVGSLDWPTVERYDSVTDQWSSISSLRKSLCAQHACTTFDDKLIVCYADCVDEYDATSNEWKTNQALKGLPGLSHIFSYSDELLITEFEEN